MQRSPWRTRAQRCKAASGGRTVPPWMRALLCAAATCCRALPHAAVSDQLGLEIGRFEAMCQADPKNISLHYTVGMLYQLAGRPQEVCDHLYEAYILDPESCDPQLLFHLANNLKAIGENDAAVDFYAQAIGKVPEGTVNWVLTAISLDYIGRPHEARRAFDTVLRLGPTRRIASWVHIYMLSALVKVGQVRRALVRYQQLVGPLMPYSRRARPRRMVAAAAEHQQGVGLVGEWDARQEARHAGSGWLWEPSTKSAIRLNLHTQALESHPSFFHAALEHRRAFQRLRRAQQEGIAHAAPHPDARGALAPAGGGASRSSKAAESQLADADEDWARETLEGLQDGRERCRGVRALVVELGRRDGRTGKIGSEIHGFGLGAQMHVLSVALSYAVRTRRVLVMRSRDNWWYTDGRDCGARSFTCYFEAVGRCSEEEVVAGLSPADLDEHGELRKLSAETEALRVVYTDVRLDNFLNQAANRVYVPAEVAHRGLLWWRAQLARYLLRPNSYVSSLLQRELDTLGWPAHPDDVVGVHVRHGDKKTESAVVPIEQYLDVALEIARGQEDEANERPGLNASKVIYISTDDPQALAAARAWHRRQLASDSLTILAREGEVRGVSTATDQVVEMHKVNVTRYGEEAVLNLLLLAHSRAFVGTFSSNFGRLAFELAYARRQADVFGASMDVFWHAYP